MRKYTEIEIELIRVDNTDVVATSITVQGDFDALKEDKSVFADLF